MKIQLTKRYLIMLVVFLIIIFFVSIIYQTTQPKLEYSIEKVSGSKNLTVEVKGNSIELNQIVQWAGSYRPQLKREDNALKIIFIRESVVSLIETYDFTARISNLKIGEYKIQLIYEEFECLYGGSKDWEHCSKLDKRRSVNTRKTFIKSDEIDVEIK